MAHLGLDPLMDDDLNYGCEFVLTPVVSDCDAWLSYLDSYWYVSLTVFPGGL